MDCPCWLIHVALAHQVGQQQCQAGIQGMQGALHTFLHPLPQHCLRVELHLGSSLFHCHAETDETLLTSKSVAPDVTSSSLKFGMSEKLAMTFRPVAIKCL